MKKLYFFLIIGFMLVAFYPQKNQIFSMNSAENPKLITSIISPYSQPQVRTLGQRQMLSDLQPRLKAENTESRYWIRTYFGGMQDDLIYSIEQTIDGGFIAGGLTWSFGAGQTDVNITKLTSEGMVEWQKTYGGPGLDGWWYVSVHQTPDNGYIVGTDFTPEGLEYSDIWVLKLDSQGNIQWQKNYTEGTDREDMARGGIQLTSDGGFVVAGYTFFYENQNDIVVLKLDSQGNIEWEKAYGGPSSEYGDFIHETTDGGYIVISSLVSSVNGLATFGLLKLNQNGDVEWQKTYPGYERTLGFYGYVEQTSDGGYIVADFTDMEEFGQYDIWLLKLDSKGKVQWQKKYGGQKRDIIGRRIQQTNDGKYIVAGYTESFGGTRLDALIFKLDSKGNVEWGKTYDIDGTEVVFDIQETNDYGYIVGGYRDTLNYDLLVMKIDQNGDVINGCPFITDVSLTVTDTYAVPVDTAFTSQNRNYSVQNTNVTPENIDMDSRVLSWDLNQPPDDVTVVTEENRSAFRKETYNIVRWNPNPYNNRFTVTEYRVYRILANEYELLDAHIPSSTFEYWDILGEEAPKYKYAVTTVVDGRESPLSEPVDSD
jgi:hypothetical protein